MNRETVSKTAPMSLRAYAKHRGVAMSAVQKAIRAGRIPTTADGKIDPAQADAEWARNTEPRPLQRRMQLKENYGQQEQPRMSTDG